MAKSKITVTGVEAIDKALSSLPTQMGRSIAKKGFSAVARMVAKEMKNNLDKTNAKKRFPEGYSALRKSIGNRVLKRSKTRNKDIYFMAVGPRHKVSIPGTVNAKKGGELKATTIASLIELGSAQFRPQPFARRTFRSTTKKAQSTLKFAIIRNLEKDVKKARAKGKM